MAGERFWNSRYEQPVSQFVPIPLDFIKGQLEQSQQQRDQVNQGLMTMGDLSSNYIAGTKDEQAVRAYQKQYQDKLSTLNQDIRNAKVDDTRDAMNKVMQFRQYKEDLSKPTGALGVIGGNKQTYDEYQKHIEDLRSKGKIEDADRAQWNLNESIKQYNQSGAFSPDVKDDLSNLTGTSYNKYNRFIGRDAADYIDRPELIKKVAGDMKESGYEWGDEQLGFVKGDNGVWQIRTKGGQSGVPVTNVASVLANRLNSDKGYQAYINETAQVKADQLIKVGLLKASDRTTYINSEMDNMFKTDVQEGITKYAHSKTTQDRSITPTPFNQGYSSAAGADLYNKTKEAANMTINTTNIIPTDPSSENNNTWNYEDYNGFQDGLLAMYGQLANIDRIAKDANNQTPEHQQKIAADRANLAAKIHTTELKQQSIDLVRKQNPQLTYKQAAAAALMDTQATGKTHTTLSIPEGTDLFKSFKNFFENPQNVTSVIPISGKTTSEIEDLNEYMKSPTQDVKYEFSPINNNITPDEDNGKVQGVYTKKIYDKNKGTWIDAGVQLNVFVNPKQGENSTQLMQNHFKLAMQSTNNEVKDAGVSMYYNHVYGKDTKQLIGGKAVVIRSGDLKGHEAKFVPLQKESDIRTSPDGKILEGKDEHYILMIDGKYVTKDKKLVDKAPDLSQVHSYTGAQIPRYFGVLNGDTLDNIIPNNFSTGMDLGTAASYGLPNYQNQNNFMTKKSGLNTNPVNTNTTTKN